MANNVLSNGRIQQQPIISQRLTRNEKGKKGISLCIILFKDYCICKILNVNKYVYMYNLSDLHL